MFGFNMLNSIQEGSPVASVDTVGRRPIVSAAGMASIPVHRGSIDFANDFSTSGQTENPYEVTFDVVVDAAACKAIDGRTFP
jgi:hypothetical protein